MKAFSITVYVLWTSFCARVSACRHAYARRHQGYDNIVPDIRAGKLKIDLLLEHLNNLDLIRRQVYIKLNQLATAA